MRPLFVFSAVVLIAVAASAQQPVPHLYGPCLYGCGPYVPLISTPMLSLQTVSPNPVGATNATTGLTAGATNSTLSQVQGSTSSSYTIPVWYQGGAPLVGPDVNVEPEPLRHEHHGMHARMVEEREIMREHAAREEAKAWTFYSGSEHTDSAASASSAAKGMHKAGHVYTNDDVSRQNDKNGEVKHDGKTEKM